MAKKKTKTSRCNCLELCNQDLKKKGLKLATKLRVNFKTMRFGEIGPLLMIERLPEASKKVPVPVMLCAFCPFCGAKLSIGSEDS